MKRENKITLIAGLIYPVMFYVSWYLSKLGLINWQRSYDNAGAILLFLSQPWSSVIYDFNIVIFLNKHLGSPAHDYLLSMLICVAFLFNVFVVKAICKWCYGKINSIT